MNHIFQFLSVAFRVDYAQPWGEIVNTLAPLRFTRTTVNEGNAYNLTSGYFVAPIDGLYSFTLHVMGSFTRTGHGEWAVVQVKNQTLSTWMTTQCGTRYLPSRPLGHLGPNFPEGDRSIHDGPEVLNGCLLDQDV